MTESFFNPGSNRGQYPYELVSPEGYRLPTQVEILRSDVRKLVFCLADILRSSTQESNKPNTTFEMWQRQLTVGILNEFINGNKFNGITRLLIGSTESSKYFYFRDDKNSNNLKVRMAVNEDSGLSSFYLALPCWANQCARVGHEDIPHRHFGENWWLRLPSDTGILIRLDHRRNCSYLINPLDTYTVPEFYRGIGFPPNTDVGGFPFTLDMKCGGINPMLALLILSDLGMTTYKKVKGSPGLKIVTTTLPSGSEITYIYNPGTIETVSLLIGEDILTIDVIKQGYAGLRDAMTAKLPEQVLSEMVGLLVTELSKFYSIPQLDRGFCSNLIYKFEAISSKTGAQQPYARI